MDFDAALVDDFGEAGGNWDLVNQQQQIVQYSPQMAAAASYGGASTSGGVGGSNGRGGDGSSANISGGGGDLSDYFLRQFTSMLSTPSLGSSAQWAAPGAVVEGDGNGTRAENGGGEGRGPSGTVDAFSDAFDGLQLGSLASMSSWVSDQCRPPD